MNRYEVYTDLPLWLLRLTHRILEAIAILSGREITAIGPEEYTAEKDAANG